MCVNYFNADRSSPESDVTRSRSDGHHSEHLRHSAIQVDTRRSSSDERLNQNDSDDDAVWTDNSRHPAPVENVETEAIFIPGRLLGTSDESSDTKSEPVYGRVMMQNDDGSSSADDVAERGPSDDDDTFSEDHKDDPSSPQAPFVRETQRCRRRQRVRRRRVADPSSRTADVTAEMNSEKLITEPSEHSPAS